MRGLDSGEVLGDSEYDPVELALEGRRVWKGWSGMFKGESSAPDASDMSTSMSDSVVGKISV